MIYRRGPWRKFEAVEFATLEWVDWFNNGKFLEPIGNLPPAEAEQRYYAMLCQSFDIARSVSSAACASQFTSTLVCGSPMRSWLQRAM